MGAHLADLGSLHSLLWLMEERERLMRIFGHQCTLDCTLSG